MEIESGPPGPDAEIIETNPGVELPVHARNLIEARNHLVLTSQKARQWAVGNQDHPVSYLLVREDVGEQAKIQALRRIETIALPAQVQELLEAARFFNDCQTASQAAFEAEQTALESDYPPESNGEVLEGLRAAYLNMLRGYRNWGGFNHYGWTSQKDQENYYGPAIWSEGDCVFRFARVLEREFPGRVHLELKINKAMTSSFDPERDRKQSVDIAVAPPGLFGAELDQKRFRRLSHDLFIEVKWLKKGRWTKSHEHLKRCEGIQKDLNSLKRSLDRGRCSHAAMLIVDDEGFLDFHGDILDWPEEVIPLVVSPGAIHDEGLGNGSMEPFLAEIDAFHEGNCPLCR